MRMLLRRGAAWQPLQQPYLIYHPISEDRQEINVVRYPLCIKPPVLLCERFAEVLQ